MTKGIAQKLLHGSAEIDRMRKEILQVCMMTLGLVKPNKICTVKVPSDKSPCQWALKFDTLEPDSDYYGYKINLICRSKKSKEDLFTKHHGSPANMMAKDVVTVYESLDEFIVGMIKSFPEIEDGLQVFLKVDDR